MEKIEDTIDTNLILLFFNLDLIHECSSTNYKKLYHYTSIKNITSIIQNHEIFFTKATDFNDDTEGQLIFDYYVEVQKSLKKDNKISEEFSKILRSVSKEDITNNLLYIDKKQNSHYIEDYDCYILCFSLSSNSKKCYNDFSEEYGGNICFSSFVLKRIQDEFNCINKYDMENLWIEKIIYSENECKKYLEKKILELYEYFIKNDIDINIYFERIRSFIINLLKHKQYSFIKPMFKKQKEIRIIYWRAKSLLSSKIIKRKKCKNNKNKEIESLKLNIGKDNNYILQVFLSHDYQNLSGKQKKCLEKFQELKIPFEFIDFNN